MGLLKFATVFAIIVLLNLAHGAKIKKTRVPKEAAAPVSIPGGFVKLAHKVSSGEIVVKDKRTIMIKQFSYDGAGPDAYFWVGKGKLTNSAYFVLIH